MIRTALIILAILTMPVHANTPNLPPRLTSFCERVLVDGGWLKPQVRAQIQPLDAQIENMGKVLAVTLDGGDSPIRYARTKRNVTDMVRVDQDFPRHFFTLENFAGKKVLDLACGEGRAVEQLLRYGVDVVGLDIHLTPYMLSKPYFIRASAHKTGLPSNSFDIIFSTQGPFTYLEHQPNMMAALMKEAQRILKVGGVLRLSSVTGYNEENKKYGGRPEIDLRNTIYTNLPPGMRLKSWPDQEWFLWASPDEGGHMARYWLELEKIED
jgi:SAM-dependent methyltransferase